jgi:ABC-type bacteriocin/lantibiotic exporter with double-glycine peptidase domain
VGPKEAVSALSVLGFKASFGRLSLTKLSEEFFPLIGFKKNGEAVVVHSAPTNHEISISNPLDRKKQDITLSEYNSEYSKYAIIVK